MKIVTTASRILLGLMFTAFPIMFFAGMMPTPKLDPESPISHFMAAFGPTGYMHAVKVLELLGGLMLLSGRFVNLGLSLLGPIIVNIFFFHVFVAKGDYPMPIVMCVLALLALLGRKDYTKVLTTL